MTKIQRGRAGELWISALPFFTSTVLIPALADFNRSNPNLTLRIEATHQYADFNNSSVDVAIRYGREQSSGLKFEPLVEVSGLASRVSWQRSDVSELTLYIPYKIQLTGCQ